MSVRAIRRQIRAAESRGSLSVGDAQRVTGRTRKGVGSNFRANEHRELSILLAQVESGAIQATPEAIGILRKRVEAGPDGWGRRGRNFIGQGLRWGAAGLALSGACLALGTLGLMAGAPVAMGLGALATFLGLMGAKATPFVALLAGVHAALVRD